MDPCLTDLHVEENELDVPDLGLQLDVPALGLQLDVPALGLQLDVPALGLHLEMSALGLQPFFQADLQVCLQNKTKM